MPRIYIGIGSNRGARALNIRRGLQLLAERGFRILKQSPIYETDPMNMPGARKFLNAVVEAETRLSPDACLGAFREVEVRLGRPTRHPRYAPRSLDLDLLLYDRVVRRPSRASPGKALEGREKGEGRRDEFRTSSFRLPAAACCLLPHPEMHRRAFVLVPLADIAPNLVHPVLHRRISTLLKEIPREGVRRWPNN